jgi:methionyl-tRNA formyltransferase
MIGESRIKLGPVAPTDADGAMAPGEIRVERNRVLVGTGSAPVQLGIVQAPGKKPMSAADWARGARLDAPRAS